MNKNCCFRHGVFFYGPTIDEFHSQLGESAAFDAKCSFIQRTADDLRAQLRRTPAHEIICIASHVYQLSHSTGEDGRQKEPHIHVLWWQRGYGFGSSKILEDFFRTRKFRGQWTSCRITSPWGMWEYLHQGGGRRIHQENLEILEKREPFAVECSSTNYGEYCFRSPNSSSGEFSSLANDSFRSPAISNPAITGAAGAAPKVRIGRRLADLFIQSGQADISSFRQWLSSKKELREEFEALLFSKKWKELIAEVTELVSEDFRILEWDKIMLLNEKFQEFKTDKYYDVETSLIWLSKILEFNNINKEEFVSNVKKVVDKIEMKKNSFWLFGDTNAGKSLIANSIVESCRFYANIMEFDEHTSFPLNDSPGKRILLINEPSIGEKRIELIKNIMEGQEVAINVKHAKGITLPRTPIIFCSNKTLWHYKPIEMPAIMNRCYMYTLSTFEELIHCEKKLNPLMWNVLYGISETNSEFFKQLSTIAYHRNWKVENLVLLDSVKSVLTTYAESFTKPHDSIHHSIKPSCDLCTASELILHYIDPPSDVNDCIACGNKTMYVFCSECITTIQ